MRSRTSLAAALVLALSAPAAAQLTAVKGGVPFPAWPTLVSGVPSLAGTYVLDANGEKGAIVFSATAAKAIHTIHLRTGTVTLGDTMDVRIETVDGAANGDPTGTLWATNTNGALVINASDDSVWKSVTLTADATMAVGDVVAIVVVNGLVGNMGLANYADTSSGFPYGDLFTASWAKQLSPLMAVVEYSDGSFEPIPGYHDSGGAINTTTFNSGTATNRRGNIFSATVPMRAKGCWIWVDADADFTCKLYAPDGTTVAATTATINTFQRQANGGGVQFYPFLATANIAAGSQYRIVAEPGASSISTYDFDVPDVDMLDMFPGGKSMQASVFTSGSWVETTTRRGYIGLIVDAFDAGGGSGGFKRFF